MEATLVDSKFVRLVAQEGQASYQNWDYMVELPDEAGERKRLVIREQSFKLDLPEQGGLVPVLVNRRRTKAVFNLDGTPISVGAKVDRQRKLQKARDEQRFAEKLRETGDG